MTPASEDNAIAFSVVIPLYNEEQSLEELHRRLTDTLATLSDRFEIIFVDDGSIDNSFAVIKNLHQRDSRVKAVRFRKNFGKSTALSAGFKKARGKIIVTLDADLQDLPCHRIESVLSLTVGKGVWDAKSKQPTPWDQFTRVDKDFPGESEVGSVHYAPNSTGDYDWSNTNKVRTYADDWLTYPNMPRRRSC